MNAQAVCLLSVPLTGPATVNPRFPVAVDSSMALPAQAVGLLELHQRSAGEPQPVAVVGVVAVQTPAVLLVVLQVDLLVRHLQLAALGAHRDVRVVAVGAGEDTLAEGRRRHLDVLLLALRSFMAVPPPEEIPEITFEEVFNGVRGEAVRNDTAGRAGADHDVVEYLANHDGARPL